MLYQDKEPTFILILAKWSTTRTEYKFDILVLLIFFLPLEGVSMFCLYFQEES